jgi:excisionase family DNA binding protein
MSNFTAAAFESLNLDAPIERMAEKVARHVISHLDHALPNSGPRIAANTATRATAMKASRTSDATLGKSLVDINELSRRLSIPKGTLYNWVYLRRIPFIKAGRSLRFDAQEVIQSLPHSPTMEEIGRGRRVFR